MSIDAHCGSVADVDLDAVAHNVALLDDLSGEAAVCAVVKADGYGHGAVPVAHAALAAGARWLGVAQIQEARALRSAGIEAPILLLSECDPDPAALDVALALDVHLVAYRPEFLDALAERARALGVPSAPVHLKVDTGMRRVGCETHQAVGLARRIVDDPHLRLAGTMTHLAVADEPGNPGTDVQLGRFEAVLAELAAAGIDPGIRHAANSAGTMLHPRSHLDMVRPGIALYGIPPAPVLASVAPLRPALRWRSAVRFVKPVAAGEGVSYGHHHVFDAPTVVATVPVGYADGFRRRLGLVGGAVLVSGVRCPIVGVVTMDQLVVDVGAVPEVEVGDEVVLLGPQGDDEITATEVALLVDTIGYEITCAISPRVPRRHHGGAEAHA
ncbi:MAG TPA: alanine racemase [Acidimicrobiales bacterium]|nr:alanine racemase [Acidimicrobiales bacterium]